ncbi:MAG: GTPase ObgE [Aggregatilineales bacterium]
MQFDEAKINVKSGDGGDGLISFRREKYIPKGGPSGGDGGRGGSIIIRVNKKINTLLSFGKRVHFKAKNGGRGGSANKTGADSDDIVIEVPPGTIIRNPDTNAMIADLTRDGDSIVVLKGGRGGRGNARFKTASNQAPRVAEKGEPGHEMWIKLELRLIADVGLVGVPNAGKSTLLSVVSNAKPKIANYPFTTLEPNLGVVLYDDRDLVFADIPGLIEGAHMGVGLGHAFLRHVQRTRLLVHVLDGSSESVLADYSQINSELALYDENLADKPQIVVFNKIDLPEAQARWGEVEAELKKRGVEPLQISAATQGNIRELIQQVFHAYSELPELEPIVDSDEIPLYEMPEDDMTFEVEREFEGVYRVSGKRVERAAAMTYWDYEEAVLRFQNILEALGVSSALETAGVKAGDTVYIGDHELEWTD